MLLHLPPEVIHEIATCDSISNKDLSSLSRVNSRLLHISRRVLYRSISIDLSSGPSDAALPPSLDSTGILIFVTTFSFSCSFPSERSGALFQQLSQVLRAMSHCTVVNLQLDPSASWILQKVKWPLLRSLHCSFPIDRHVAKVLSHAHWLQSLQVLPTTQDHPSNIFTSLCCPRLHHFMGSPDDAGALLPGRSIECLHIQGADLTLEILDTFPHSARHVKVLEATIEPSQLIELLSQISHIMPSLFHLRLVSKYPIFGNLFNEDEISDILQSMYELCSVELCDSFWTRSSTHHRWILPAFLVPAEDSHDTEWSSWGI